MPPALFTLVLIAVIAAAGLTVWLIAGGGGAVPLVALPLALLASLIVRMLRR